eukprot:823166-Alexandrium_andersonii.AAC.1
MSASLVGSEMCIRDRRSTASIWARKAIFHRARPHGQQHSDSSAFSNCSAVSYTHLTLPTICSV